MVLWCFARVLVAAGWGCGPMARHDFQKRKKMPPRKSMGKGFNVPGNLEKRMSPQKKVRKKQVGVIDSPAADVPGVFPNLAVPVGIP